MNMNINVNEMNLIFTEDLYFSKPYENTWTHIQCLILQVLLLLS